MEYNPKTIMKHVVMRATVWVPLLATVVLLSCVSDDGTAGPSYDKSGRLQVSASVDDNWEETRGLPVETELEESFGLYAYTYGKNDSWSNQLVPDMLCDQEVSMVPEGWATTSLISLPDGEDTKMQFFAYYPYRNPELATEEFQFLTSRPQWDADLQTGDAGNPQFGYLTADNAVDQLDFMVGVSTVYQKSANFFKTPVKLKFRHMLSGVVFKVGPNFREAMTINSISLTNVYKEGKLTVTPPDEPDTTDPNYDPKKVYDSANYSWDNLSNPGTVTVKVDFPVKRIEPNSNPSKTDVGRVMNTDDLVMFLIPQTLSQTQSSTLELVVNDGVPLSATLGQIELKMGKITIINISVTSLMKITLTTQIVDWNSSDDNIFGGSAQDGKAIIPASEIFDWGVTTPSDNTLQQPTE